MTDSSDPRVPLKVEIPKSLDRDVEIEVAKRSTTKRQFVIDALKIHVRTKERAA